MMDSHLSRLVEQYSRQVLEERAKYLEGLIATILLRHPDLAVADLVLVEERGEPGRRTRWWLEPKEIADRRPSA